MPHLAPMKWFLLPIMFWALLLITLSLTWWHTTPSFPHYNISSTNSPMIWPWN